MINTLLEVMLWITSIYVTLGAIMGITLLAHRRAVKKDPDQCALAAIKGGQYEADFKKYTDSPFVTFFMQVFAWWPSYLWRICAPLKSNELRA